MAQITSKQNIRIILLVFIICASIYITAGAITAPERLPERIDDGTVAPPTEGITVITTQSYGKKGWHNAITGDSPGELVAVKRSGQVLYYNNTYQSYWDVDPSPNGELTVMYVASEHLSAEQCHATTECYRNRVMRTNLSTGESELLFSRIARNEQSVRWHDVDRVEENRYAVADIENDRVFIINSSTNMITWGWDAQSEYELSSGGDFPKDWTHINDVEVLPGGRILADLRNQDQVVFIERETGVDQEWTLGEDDNHDIVSGQHNPDYISNSEGQSALLIADSGNDRVIEYLRSNNTWKRSWSYSDARLTWPRDADRLPNGNTLITDSRGGRVFEINDSGSVVWSMDISLPYEAERLGTGSESDGGEINQVGVSNQEDTASTSNGGFSLRSLVFAIFPGEVLVAVSWILPSWMGVFDAAVLFGGIGALLFWIALEVYWSPYSISVHHPVTVRKR